MTRKKSPASNKAATTSGKTPAPAKQKKTFGRCLADFLPLLPAEKKLLDAVAIGEMCWLCDPENPVRPEQKTKDNEIRATLIRFLALGGDADVFVHEMGIQVAGAFVSGELNLVNASNIKALLLIYTVFTNPLHLEQSTVDLINLIGSLIPGFFGDGMSIHGGLKLQIIQCQSLISLKNTTIYGPLECNGAYLEGHSNQAVLICDNLRVYKGDVLLAHGFKANGEVRFHSAIIEGSFDCVGGTFTATKDLALNCDGINIQNRAILANGFKAIGEVCFDNAIVGTNFICQQGTFINPNSISFSAENITIHGGLSLRHGFKAIGQVIFPLSKIGKRVDCSNANFSAMGDKALHFENTVVGGDVLLSDDFHAGGQVRFKNATIGGDFKFEEDSSIENTGKTALHCEGISVGGNVLLRQSEDSSGKLQINGKTNFMDARIGKGFDCSFAELTHLEPESEGSSIAGYALNLQGADIGGALTLRHNDIYGSLCLLKTHADTLNDRPDSWPQPAIAQKTGLFQKLKTFLSPLWHWDFSGKQNAAAIKPTARRASEDEGALQGVESDDKENPAQSNKTQTASSAGLSSVIALDGFRYNQIAGGSPTDATTRLDWLRLQRPSALWEKFRPQPFEQLIKVLRQTGYEEEARQLYIDKYDQKQKAKLQQAKCCNVSLLQPLQAIFFWLFLGRATGYGKRPARLLGLLIFLWGSAAFWYSQAAQQDVFAPSHPLIFLKYDQKPDCQKNWVNCIKNAKDEHNPELQAYTVFSPYLYSFDVMIPILNLHQEGDWGPKMKKVQILGIQMASWSTWFVMWSQIILGWLGSFMLIAMLSGWLQKE